MLIAVQMQHSRQISSFMEEAVTVAETTSGMVAVV